MNPKHAIILVAIILSSACQTTPQSVTTNTPIIEFNPASSTATPQEIPTFTDTPTESPPSTFTPSASPGISPTPEPSITASRSVTKTDQSGEVIIIDHTSLDLFKHIPPEYIKAARELRLLFSDRSVGQNINEALDCLAAPSWEQSAPGCRRDYFDANWNWKLYVLSDLTSGAVPSRIQFDPSPLTYNRDNWTFEFKEGVWSDLTQDFIQVLAPTYINSKDVLTYQFSYLNVQDSDDIADPQNGFFANNPNRYDIYDLEAFIAQHPDKTFFFWTTSLARSIGTQTSQNFNDQMRQYAREHHKILFDFADIESRTDQGAACVDNRDGVQYCNQVTGKCENYPSDGHDYPAICQDYTTEVDAGHLGSVSAGKIAAAKAFWVLMARIAGWDGRVVSSP